MPSVGPGRQPPRGLRSLNQAAAVGHVFSLRREISIETASAGKVIAGYRH